jgi:hypothetical protein
MVYLDFSKAFDKVPIKRLLLKIKAAGITKKLLTGLKIGWINVCKELYLMVKCQNGSW